MSNKKRWTPEETAELKHDISVQGFEVAVRNFVARYNMTHERVYNKAWQLIRHSKEQSPEKSSVFSTPKHGGVTFAPKGTVGERTPIPRITKADKIVIMLSKECMAGIVMRYEESSLIIEHDGKRQLDIRII